MGEEMRRISLKRYLLMALGLAALAVTAFLAVEMIAPQPGEADTSRTKTTQHELFVASIEPGVTPVPQGRMHDWTLTVTTAEGDPVDGARITVDGGMPQHGHGLPTEPEVTGNVGEGKYRVEGVEFNMGGDWELRFDIASPRGDDTVTFHVMVKP